MPGAAAHLLAAAAALLACALRAQLAQPSARQTRALPFEVVWDLSFCASRVTLVDVLSEFPHDVEYIYKPLCVPLSRCNGCCNDERLECAPVETRPLDLQVMRISVLQRTAEQVVLTFMEHMRCTCRRREMRWKDERHRRTGAKRRPRKPSPAPLAPPRSLPLGKGTSN